MKRSVWLRPSASPTNTHWFHYWKIVQTFEEVSTEPIKLLLRKVLHLLPNTFITL